MPANRTCACALLTAASLSVHATCDFNVEVNDSMAFQIKEMVAEQSCEAITVKISHTGQLPRATMGHNWTLSKTADLQGIALDGMSAGLDNNYIKPGDERVIAHTKMVGGGESDSISFSPSGMSPGEDYSFFCSFPGHWAVMQGKFVLK
jgi:azurin